jgi:hypothetical protein
MMSESTRRAAAIGTIGELGATYAVFEKIGFVPSVRVKLCPSPNVVIDAERKKPVTDALVVDHAAGGNLPMEEAGYIITSYLLLPS